MGPEKAIPTGGFDWNKTSHHVPVRIKRTKNNHVGNPIIDLPFGDGLVSGLPHEWVLSFI